MGLIALDCPQRDDVIGYITDDHTLHDILYVRAAQRGFYGRPMLYVVLWEAHFNVK